MERSVEFLKHRIPYLLAFSNFVEVFLYGCSKLIVKDLREVLNKVVSYDYSDFLREKTALFSSYCFCLCVFLDDAFLKSEFCNCLLLTRLVSLGDVASGFCQSGDGRGVCRRSSDAELFKFLHKGRLRISCWCLSELALSADLHVEHAVSYIHFRKNDDFVILLRFVAAFYIELEETIKKNLAGLHIELFLHSRSTDLYVGLEYACICHLRGHSTLPDQFIKFLLLRCSLSLGVLDVGWPDGFVSLLSTF